MKKETIIALILGILAGTAIAVALLFIVKETTIRSKKVLAPQTSPAVEKNPEVVEELTIKKPSDNSIVSKNQITIEGQGQKGSLIVAQSPAGSATTEVEKASFKIDVPLILGENMIRIASFYKNNTDEEIINIFYIKK